MLYILSPTPETSRKSAVFDNRFGDAEAVDTAGVAHPFAASLS
jgi:hypothetical protein